MRALAPSPRRPVTIADCPHCGGRLLPERSRGNHDRPAVRFQRCEDCGHQQGHVVEMEVA